LFSYTVRAIAAPHSTPSRSSRRVGGTAGAASSLLDSLGLRLRASRGAAGISLRELARRVGISPSAVSQIERGLSSPSLPTIVALANELHLSVDYLLGIDVPQNGGGPAGTVVTRASTRGQTPLSRGVRCGALASEPDRGVELFLAWFDPAARAGVDELPFPAGRGSLFAVVVEGSIRLVTAKGEDELEPGEAVELERETLRSIRNGETRTAAVVLASLESTSRAEAPPAATRSSSSARRRPG
jgi:transcriptional regulator with XRE-family HTH domain